MSSFPASRYTLAIIKTLELEELDTRKDIALELLFTRCDIDLDFMK